MRAAARFLRDCAALLAIALAIGFALATMLRVVEAAQLAIGVEPARCLSDSECCKLSGGCEVPR